MKYLWFSQERERLARSYSKKALGLAVLACLFLFGGSVATIATGWAVFVEIALLTAAPCLCAASIVNTDAAMVRVVNGQDRINWKLDKLAETIKQKPRRVSHV